MPDSCERALASQRFESAMLHHPPKSLIISDLSRKKGWYYSK
jgi:hypothetical protein